MRAQHPHTALSEAPIQVYVWWGRWCTCMQHEMHQQWMSNVHSVAEARLYTHCNPATTVITQGVILLHVSVFHTMNMAETCGALHMSSRCLQQPWYV